MFKNLSKELKEFILRGNVLDMAVGIIIGASFKSIEDNQIPVQLSDLMALTDSSLIDVNSVLESVDSFETSSKDPEVMAELNFEKIIRIQRYGNEK